MANEYSCYAIYGRKTIITAQGNRYFMLTFCYILHFFLYYILCFIFILYFMFCDTFYVIYDTFYDILYDIFYVYLFRDLLIIHGSLSWLINLFLYFFIVIHFFYLWVLFFISTTFILSPHILPHTPYPRELPMCS